MFFFFFINFFFSMKNKIKIYSIKLFKFFFQKKNFIRNWTQYCQKNFLKNHIRVKNENFKYKNNWMNIKYNFFFVSKKEILPKNFIIFNFLKIFDIILVKITIEKYSILIVFLFSFIFEQFFTTENKIKV